MKTLVLLAILTGCTMESTESAHVQISWDAACEEQVAAYCDTIGVPRTGCTILDVGRACGPGPDVSLDDQTRCLADIARLPDDHDAFRCGWKVCPFPKSCSGMWPAD